MTSRGALLHLALVVSALAAAGCGSTHDTTRRTATAHFGGGGEPPLRHQVIYKVNMIYRSAEAPKASGLAVVTSEPKNGRLCWDVSQLKNVVPTGVRIYRPFPGAPGFDLGNGYEPAGCRYGLSPLFLEVFTEKDFYIGIESGPSHTVVLGGKIGVASP
jgi:hypothetical protein